MSSKKPLVERERRRQRAKQMSKAITGQKNENTQTNLTYNKIMEEDNKAKRARKGIKDQETPIDDYEAENDEANFIEEEDDEESTGASQDSESSDSNASIDNDQENQTDRKEFLFAGSGSFIKYWNYSIIILALYNSILIPLQIFYNDQGHT